VWRIGALAPGQEPYGRCGRHVGPAISGDGARREVHAHERAQRSVLAPFCDLDRLNACGQVREVDRVPGLDCALDHGSAIDAEPHDTGLAREGGAEPQCEAWQARSEPGVPGRITPPRDRAEPRQGDERPRSANTRAPRQGCRRRHGEQRQQTQNGEVPRHSETTDRLPAQVRRRGLLRAPAPPVSAAGARSGCLRSGRFTTRLVEPLGSTKPKRYPYS
jgi:hypothetical protein